MQFTHTVTYAAPLADVHAMLSDPAFREKACAAMGVISADVTVTPKDDGFTLVIDQVQPTEGVPAFAKKFAGETTQVIQTEEWGATSGTITIEAPGKPTTMQGTVTLSETDGVTTETMDAEVKVKVPLLGGKLESLMADLIRAGMDRENTAGQAWLRGER